MTTIACPSCGATNRVPSAVGKGHPRCGRCSTDLPWVVAATDADFDRVAAGSPLVLVDLWAPWCGPCRMVAPVLEALARRYAGRLKVVKVNVDESRGVAGRFGAQSIPTLVVLDGGREVDRVIGARGEAELASVVERALAARAT
jgi:thioredoxin 2